MRLPTRRGFIEKSALGGLILSTVLVRSCSDNRGSIEPTNPDQAGKFEYGVASFDPTDHQIILWTRVTPGINTPKVTLTYQIALDMAFTNVLKTESVSITSPGFEAFIDADPAVLAGFK